MIVLIIVFIVIMLYPHKLTEYFGPTTKIDVVVIESLSENGISHSQSNMYDDLTQAQKEQLVTLCERFTYHKSLNFFKTSTISGSKNYQLLFKVVKNNETVSIYVDSQGTLEIESRIYKMKSAEIFLKEVVELLHE